MNKTKPLNLFDIKYNILSKIFDKSRDKYKITQKGNFFLKSKNKHCKI